MDERDYVIILVVQLIWRIEKFLQEKLMIYERTYWSTIKR